jgi:S-DNA-T family DNA segregation ATPase FtsK/SpoIIIE
VPDTDNHLIVFGDAECGKTNLLRYLARTIVDRYPPEQAKFVVIDYRRSLLGVVSGKHLLDYAPSAQVADEVGVGLVTALTKRLPGPDVTPDRLRKRDWWTGPDVYVLIDDYDMVAGSSTNPLVGLVDLLPQARDIGLHVIVARRASGAQRALFDPLLQRLRELESPGLLMSGSREEGPLIGNVFAQQQPPGRGMLVRRRDGSRIVQTAWLPDET